MTTYDGFDYYRLLVVGFVLGLIWFWVVIGFCWLFCWLFVFSVVWWLFWYLFDWDCWLLFGGGVWVVICSYGVGCALVVGFGVSIVMHLIVITVCWCLLCRCLVW